MKRLLALIYGVVVYAFFFCTFVYAMLFVIGLWVPKTIDSGTEGSMPIAILVNVGILALFAIQHTIMARPEFKQAVADVLPPPIERSTFVLAATAILALLMWQWRPLTSISFWHLETAWLRIMLHAIAFSGFGLVLYSTFIIDHFDLFGLRQVWLYYRGKTYTHPPFMQRSVYKYIRHPLMTGFLIGFWVTPDMTLGHLLFAAVCTGYILVGVMIEERDLVRFIGDDYSEYRKTTPAYIPFTKRRSTGASVVNEDSIDPRPAE